MKYRTLGKSGLHVSVIGVGTWQFGGEWGKNFTHAEVVKMLARARELGINLIDTAECYGDHLSEELIGSALEELGARKDFVIASKFGHKFHSHLNRTNPRTPGDIQIQLDDSLKALRTDHIDLHQYHSWGDAEFFNEGVREILAKAKRAGKIKHIGNSLGPNDSATQVNKSLEYDVETIQLVYNRLDRAPEAAVLPACKKLNLGVLARVPLASGYLSGKYKPGATFGQTDVRSKWKPNNLDEQLQEVQRIAREEVPAGVDMAQWALAWCLRLPEVTCVIPGCKDVQQVEQNARAAELV